MQRGRKSAAALAVVPVSLVPPGPPIPSTLNAAQRGVWLAVAGSLPSGWLKGEHAQMLARYCIHSVRASEIEVLIAETDPRTDVDSYCRLCRLGQAESAQALSLARALRLTPQSQVRQESASRMREQQQGRPGIEALYETDPS